MALASRRDSGSRRRFGRGAVVLHHPLAQDLVGGFDGINVNGKQIMAGVFGR